MLPGRRRPADPVLPAPWAIESARTRGARRRGLLGRSALGPYDGLWLPVRSVHTIGMRFPIDLVWIDRAGGVVEVDVGVAPGRLRTSRRAHGGVVEVAAGRGGALAMGIGAVGV